jgi:branched-chain amino acid transport system substrate-binding protein
LPRAPALKLLALTVAGILLFSAPAAAELPVVKIVSSLPRTGSAKAQTDTIVNGIRIAIAEAEERGRQGKGPAAKYQIEYLDFDDATAAAGQWTAEAETANANLAVNDVEVLAYLGTYNSGAAKISMPILNQAPLLMVSPANTAPGLTKPGLGDPGEPYIYRLTGKVNFTRVVPADDLQGSLGAAWAAELGVRRVFVLDDNEVYGRGIALMFVDACREMGIEVLGHESIDVKAPEFRSLMSMIKWYEPDLIYFGGSTQSKGGQIAKDMRAAGLTCKLMVPDACFEDAFITSAGLENVADNCYATFGGLPPDAQQGKGKEFVEKYRSRFDAEPEAYAIYGYEAAKAALEAIDRAELKPKQTTAERRQAVIDACLALKDFNEGALGPWSFDENGDTTIKTVSGSIIRRRVDKPGEGKFEFVKLLKPFQGRIAPTAAASPGLTVTDHWKMFVQLCLIGLANGALIALIALGYTMVYGIVELINFAHGDVFMLGSFLALTIVGALGLNQPEASGLLILGGLAVAFLTSAAFCATVNFGIDRLVYRPLRTAPKLAPLVSAIGVSFVLMNVGLFWGGAADRDFPELIPQINLLGENAKLQFTLSDLMVVVTTVPIMIGLTLLIKYSRLGKAMRATAQNPVAARLMGINVDRVIGATFLIGGGLAGAASVIYSLYINTISYQMGFTNGLYAFTAAVLGGIGNIPGAVLGGVMLGLVRAIGTGYVGERWTTPLIFAILIAILVFRPAGLLGTRSREKV